MAALGGSANQQAAPGQQHPIVEEVAVHTSASGFTHVVDYPAVTEAGELLYAFTGVDGGEGITTPAGWTLHFDTVELGDLRVRCYGRIADGTEGGTTVDWVTEESQQFAVQMFRISAWSGSLTDIIAEREWDTYTAETQTTPWGSFAVMWIACIVASMTNTYISHAPGYSDFLETSTGAGTSHVQIYSCRLLNQASSESPGAWVFSGSSLTWLIINVHVKGAETV